jgi:hypothetical protein
MNGSDQDGQASSRIPISKKKHMSKTTTNNTGDPACRRVRFITVKPRGPHWRS